MLHHRGFFRALYVLAAVTILGSGLAGATGASAPTSYSHFPVPGDINTDFLSQGARLWFEGPQASGEDRQPPSVLPSFGSNVDANDPNGDLAPGQSETAIAADGNRVLVAWNDVSAFLDSSDSTSRRASGTGVGISSDGAKTFTDLVGLPNDNPNQQWLGDPTIVALGDGVHFVVGSLYFPSLNADCSRGSVVFAIAVSLATVSGATVAFSKPIVAATGGDLCVDPFGDIVDKPFLSFNRTAQRLVVSYTRFGFFDDFNGQIEVVRAVVTPSNPTPQFFVPRVIWRDEPEVVNTGAYPAVAPNGDVFVAWERNVFSNQFNGDPYVYINVARLRLGEMNPDIGRPTDPRVVTLGQSNSSPQGGVKSLDVVPIPGYSRFFGQDFPRIAFDPTRNKVVIVWNDASLHPLGDIFLRALDPDLHIAGSIRKVNDDNSFAVHFLPAVSVRSDGSIATSWYDRRRAGTNSTLTEYFAEVRSGPSNNGTDFRVTTGPTDWANTSSAINPNFGDYTDNASTGTTTYFTWADGRIGVPQPFVDSRN